MTHLFVPLYHRYDVLFMTEPLDELTVQAIGEYGGKALTDLGKENVDFAGDEDEKAKKEEQSTDTQGKRRGPFVCRVSDDCRVGFGKADRESLSGCFLEEKRLPAGVTVASMSLVYLKCTRRQ